MAIEIPRLNRIDPAAPTSVGRIETQTPDAAKAVGQVSNSISNFGGELAAYVGKIEDQSISNQALEIGNEYEEWYRGEVDGRINPDGTTKLGLRHLQGDPTSAYAKFDEEAEKKRSDILNRDDLTERAKKYITGHLGKLSNQLNDKRTTVFGFQYDKWQQDTKDRAIKLGKMRSQDAAAYINPNDKQSILMFDQTLSDIQKLDIENAFKVGTAVIDPKGPYTYTTEDGQEIKYNGSPSLNLQVKENLADAVYQSIDNQINAQKPEVAKFMLDKYGDYVDEKRKSELIKSMNVANTDAEAYTILAKMDNKTLEQKKQILKQMPADKIKVREKALDLLTMHENRMETLKKNQDEEFYDRAWQIVHKRQQSEDPIESVAQLDMVIKPFSSKLSPKSRKSLEDMIISPTISDPDVIDKNYQMVQDGSYIGLSAKDLSKSLSGTSAKDQKTLRGIWTRLNTESTAQERSKVQYGVRSFDKAYEESGLEMRIRGKETKASMAKKNKYREEFMSLYDGISGNLSAREQDQAVSDYMARIKIIEQNNKRNTGFFGFGGEPAQPVPDIPSLRRPRGSSGSFEPETDEEVKPVPKTKSVTPTGKEYSKMSDSEKRTAMTQFKEAHNGQKAKSVDELKQWLKNKK